MVFSWVCESTGKNLYAMLAINLYNTQMPTHYHRHAGNPN